MIVSEIVAHLPDPALPGADWADSYEAGFAIPFASARHAAEAIVAAFPVWTMPMLVLRSLLVLPFGLKGTSGTGPSDRIGIFPVVAETADRMVAGFDDRHLDFRIVVDIAPRAVGQTLKLTTVIRRHNLLGRCYLMLVLPFHRAIIRSALMKVAASRS